MIPDTWECILRLTLAALFGGIIGLERELRAKGAGIRTHLIVAFASCMMMLVSKYGFSDVLENEAIKLDPSRISAGLVTAIGFLGAGTIFVRNGGVTGLTTAAGLWATVGIGMTTGAGMYPLCAFGTVFIVAVQGILYRDHALLGNVSVVLHVQIVDLPEALEGLYRELDKLGLKPAAAKFERSGGTMSIEFQLDHIPCPEQELSKLISTLMELSYVKSAAC